MTKDNNSKIYRLGINYKVCFGCRELVDIFDDFTFRGKTFEDGSIIGYLPSATICFKCQRKMRESIGIDKI